MSDHDRAVALFTLGRPFTSALAPAEQIRLLEALEAALVSPVPASHAARGDGWDPARTDVLGPTWIPRRASRTG